MITWERRLRKRDKDIWDDCLVSGKIMIGTVAWHQNRRDRLRPFHWKLNLPGSNREGYAPTVAEGKAAAEASFLQWCAASALQVV